MPAFTSSNTPKRHCRLPVYGPCYLKKISLKAITLSIAGGKIATITITTIKRVAVDLKSQNFNNRRVNDLRKNIVEQTSA